MKENIIHSKNHVIFIPSIVYVLSNCNNNISISMHINPIANIRRAVLGPARCVFFIFIFFKIIFYRNIFSVS